MSCVLYAPKYDELADLTSKWLNDHRSIAQAYKTGSVDEACAELRQHISAAQIHLEKKR